MFKLTLILFQKLLNLKEVSPLFSIYPIFQILTQTKVMELVQLEHIRLGFFKFSSKYANNS